MGTAIMVKHDVSAEKAPGTVASNAHMRRVRWTRVQQYLAPPLAILCIVILWEVACRWFAIAEFILPAPSRIFVAAFSMSGSVWLSQIFATLFVALCGYALAILISLPLAVMLATSRTLSSVLYPILIIIHSAPIVAIAPIIVVTMGIGDLPRIVITTIIAFFPLMISATTGLMATPSELLELSRSLRAPKSREILQIRLPFAVPHIFSALKISITLSVVGAVVSEFVAAEQGLGYTIMLSTSSFKLPLAFAALVLLVAMSLILFQLVVLVQKIWFRWSLPDEADNA